MNTPLGLRAWRYGGQQAPSATPKEESMRQLACLRHRGLKADVELVVRGSCAEKGAREGSPPGCVFSLQVLRNSEVK